MDMEGSNKKRPSKHPMVQAGESICEIPKCVSLTLLFHGQVVGTLDFTLSPATLGLGHPQCPGSPLLLQPTEP